MCARARVRESAGMYVFTRIFSKLLEQHSNRSNHISPDSWKFCLIFFFTTSLSPNAPIHTLMIMLCRKASSNLYSTGPRTVGGAINYNSSTIQINKQTIIPAKKKKKHSYGSYLCLMGQR